LETKAQIDELHRAMMQMSRSRNAGEVRRRFLSEIPLKVVAFRERHIHEQEVVIERLNAGMAHLEQHRKQERDQRMRETQERAQKLSTRPRRATDKAPPVPEKPIPMADKALPVQITSVPPQPEVPSPPPSSPRGSPEIRPTPSGPSTMVMLELPDDYSDSGDSFSEAIQVAGNNVRFTGMFIDSQTRILDGLSGDSNAYEALLRATRAFDGPHQEIVSQVQESLQLLYDGGGQLKSFQLKQARLLQMLRTSKRVHVEDLKTIDDLRRLITAMKLEEQTRQLNDAQNVRMSPSGSQVVDQLGLVQKMESALEVVTQLDILSQPESQQQHRALTLRVIDFREQLVGGGALSQPLLDETLVHLQAFIAELKPTLRETALIESRLQESAQASEKKMKSLSREIRALQEKLAAETDLKENLLRRLSVVQSRLGDQQNLSDSTLSMHNAQLATLRSLLQTLNMSDSPSNPDDLLVAIRDQVLSMQGLMETSVHEREIFKSRAMEMEDRLTAISEESQWVKTQLDDLKNRNAELEVQIRKERDQNRFRETDLKKLKMERAIALQSEASKDAQTREIMALNSKLNMDNLDKDAKLRKIKERLMAAQNEIEELSIKIQFGRFSRGLPKVTVATQTQFRVVRRAAPSELPSPGPEAAPPADIPPSPATEPETADVSTELVVEEEEAVEEEVPEEEVDHDRFSEALIDVGPRENVANRWTAEDAPISEVHAPLDWHRKKPTSILFVSPKQPRPKTPAHPKWSLVQTVEDSPQLAVGDVTPGRRQILSQNRKIRPTLPAKAAKFAPIPSLEPLEGALQLTPLPATQPISPNPPSTPHTPLTPHAIPRLRKEPLSDLSETIRITRIEYEEPPPSPTKLPIVHPFVPTDYQPASPPGPATSLKFDELHRIVTRLRDEVQKLRHQNVKKDAEAADSKRKLTVAIKEGQQQRLALTRAEEETRHVKLENEDLRLRQEIILEELWAREEELNELQREVMQLRALSGPAIVKLNSLKMAQEQQRRLIKEKQRQNEMVTVASRALQRGPNMETQKHLASVLDNTKKTLVRLEAKRTIWKEIEKKQMMAALGALCLIADRPSIHYQIRPDSPFRKGRLQMSKPGQPPAKEDTEEVEPLDDSRPKPFPTYGKAIQMIDQMEPPLSRDEQEQLIKRRADTELVEKIQQKEAEMDQAASLDGEVISPS
jgi:hypothetical protein